MTTTKSHSEDCLCVPCMMADLDGHLEAQGIDPARYHDGRNGENVAAQRTRYAQGGQACGSGTVRLLSSRQVRFIERLLAERDTSNLVRLPGSENIEKMSLRGARDLIDRLLACPERTDVIRGARQATEPMKSFLRRLIAERDAFGIDVPDVSTIEFGAAKVMIDILLARPYARKAAPTSKAVEGIHLLDGKVFKVQRAVHGSGNLYAKVLNPETGKFEYAPGTVGRLSEETLMSLDQAREFGALYGMCCSCGRTLTDETSIEAGIGPVCSKKFTR